MVGLSPIVLVTLTKQQNKLGLDEVPTLNYGGKGGDGSDDEGGAGAADAPAEKTLWKVKVTGFGEKAKIKVRPRCVRVHRTNMCCALQVLCCTET